MGLYYRWRRLCGEDTTTEITHEETLYEYEVEHLNGDITRVEGHRDTKDGAFLIVKKANDTDWAVITFNPNNDITCKPHLGSTGYEKVAELEGIKEINKTVLGYDRWIFTVDKADGKHLETKKEYEKV